MIPQDVLNKLAYHALCPPIGPDGQEMHEPYELLRLALRMNEEEASLDAMWERS